MNITEYRELKAQMEAEQAEGDKGLENSVPESPENGTEPLVEEPMATPDDFIEPTLPETIEIEGIGAVPIDELRQGYMRQSDYTRKTQELAQNRKRIEEAQKVYQGITSNPDLAQMLINDHGIDIRDPRDLENEELRERYQDMLLEQEINSLQSKYEDFNPMEVLPFAYQNRLENLEQAYQLVKQSKLSATPAPEFDVASLTEQIRQQVLAELQSNVDTSSLIQSGGDSAPVTSNTPTLSQQEMKVARNLRMSPEEYAKWREKR